MQESSGKNKFARNINKVADGIMKIDQFSEGYTMKIEGHKDRNYSWLGVFLSIFLALVMAIFV